MIRYALLCEHDHEFDSWFDNSTAYDRLQKAALIECPHCGSRKIRKALMTPQIGVKRSSGNRQRPIAQSDKNSRELEKVQTEIVKMARRLRRHIEKTSEHVGDRFAVEARKIHYEEAKPRNIYGSATKKEVHELLEDGINITPLPDLPEDKN